MSSLLEKKKKSTTTQKGVIAKMYLSHHQTTSNRVPRALEQSLPSRGSAVLTRRLHKY